MLIIEIEVTAKNDNFCTACIPNAEIVDGSMGFCQCQKGFYLDTKSKTCKKCHEYCDGCTGPSTFDCVKCKSYRPRWNGDCKTDCGDIEYPYNLTYVFSGMPENTCKSCFDFYYTVNSQLCLPQPYPMKIRNYNNNYLIL